MKYYCLILNFCRSKEQLSVYRGEIVDVLEKKTDSVLVRNTLGEQGLVPAACLSADKQPSRKQSPTIQRKDSQPQPSSRRGSNYGIGDVPNFDPTPIPHNIPPPPPDIPPNWPYSTPVERVASPTQKQKSKSDHYLAFEDAGIIRELSKRKPLRTTSSNPKNSPSKEPDVVQSEIALKFQREPPIAKKPKIKPITMDSTKEEVLRWLQQFSYLIAAERLRGMNGRNLITISKEELRNICGFGEGTRLYTHLQKQGKGHQPESMSSIVPGRNPGDEVETGGFTKFLKEHRDKVSGGSPSAVEESPSVWQQMQASKEEAEKLERRRQKEEIWAKRRRTRELEEQVDALGSEAPLEQGLKSKSGKNFILIKFQLIDNLICIDYDIIHYSIIHYNIIHYSIIHYDIIHYDIIHYNIIHYNIIHYSIIHYNIIHYNIIHYSIIHSDIIHYSIIHYNIIHSDIIHSDIIHYDIIHYNIIRYNIIHYDIIHYSIIHYNIIHSDIIHYDIIHYDIIHYNIIHYDIIHYNIIHYDIIHYDIIHYNIIHYDIIHYNIIHYDIIHYDIIHYNIIHYDIIHYDIIHYDIIHYSIIHYNIIHYDIIHYDIIHYDIIHYNIIYH